MKAFLLMILEFIWSKFKTSYDEGKLVEATTEAKSSKEFAKTIDEANKVESNIKDAIEDVEIADPLADDVFGVDDWNE